MSSPTQPKSATSALMRRRAGIKAAHELRTSAPVRPLKNQALSLRALSLVERHGTSPALPTRVASYPELCLSGSDDVRTTLAQQDQPASIPSLDRKIQTLMNLEGRSFLHSSLTPPIPPFRELSCPNLFPSGHSRATVLLEDQEHPTSIPAAEQKARTLLNREGQEFLHSNMTCPPTKPLREPSNNNLCPSGHSRATVLLEDQENPTSIPAADRKNRTLQSREGMGFLHSSTKSPLQPVREPSSHRFGQPDVILVASALTAQESATSLSNSRQPLRMSSVHSIPSLGSLPTIASSGWSAELSEEDDDILSEEETEPSIRYQDIRLDRPLLSPLPPKQTNTNALESDDGDDSRNINATEVAALKKHWADLGKRINVMETAQQPRNTAAFGIEGSMADLLKRIEAMESQHGLVATGCQEQTTRKLSSATMGADKNPSVETAQAEKSKSRSAGARTTTGRSRLKKGSHSSESTTAKSNAPRSKSVDAGHRATRASRPRRRSGSLTRPASKSVSRKPRGKPRQHKEGASTQDGSGSAHCSRPHTMVDSSGASSSRCSMTMKDGSGGSSSSRRQSQNRRNSREPCTVKLEQSTSKRLSSGRLRARAKLVHVDGTKSENDVTGPRAQKIKGRPGQPMDAALKALSKSPCKPSPTTSKGRRLKSSPGGSHRLSQSTRTMSVPHFGNEAQGRMPVVGDLESRDKRDGASWKSQNGHRSVASMGSPSVTPSIPLLASKVVRSRGVKGLVF